jgi:hypothetical protein
LCEPNPTEQAFDTRIATKDVVAGIKLERNDTRRSFIARELQRLESAIEITI